MLIQSYSILVNVEDSTFSKKNGFSFKSRQQIISTHSSCNNVHEALSDCLYLMIF